MITKALVDTGSPRCVFPRGIADLLGLEFPKKPPVTVHLMGEKWPAITSNVTLVLPPFDDLSWDAEVDFVAEEGLPFALLGYEGFLNRWAVSFNAYHSYFVVEPIEDFEGRLSPDPFDELQERFPDDYRPRE